MFSCDIGVSWLLIPRYLCKMFSAKVPPEVVYLDFGLQHLYTDGST